MRRTNVIVPAADDQRENTLMAILMAKKFSSAVGRLRTHLDRI